MRKKLIIVIIMFVCLFSISGCSFKRGDKPAKLNDVETENFNYTFLQLEASKNNMIYSPLSIKYALSMLSLEKARLPSPMNSHVTFFAVLPYSSAGSSGEAV